MNTIVTLSVWRLDVHGALEVLRHDCLLKASPDNPQLLLQELFAIPELRGHWQFNRIARRTKNGIIQVEDHPDTQWLTEVIWGSD